MKSPREALQPEAAPPPPPSTPRRRISLVSVVSGVLSFLIVAVVVVAIGWSFAAKKIVSPGPLTADTIVDIPKGDDVAQTLEDHGVIDSASVMKAALLVEGNKSNVKAGEYQFKQAASLQDVIDTLISGKQILHSVTIPEGLTSLQIVDRLRDNDVLVGDIKNIPPEGSLMPDTYKFARGTTRDTVIRNMQAESKRIIADIWAHHDASIPIRSPYEMVTLASIVEKETGKSDERGRVAGVFINRLQKNIPLQSDPTIVYGLVGGKGTLGRGILKSELEQKTPYNTYTIVGLPPGPICNPGRAALEAVANPSKTRELYFVADGTGGHAFAETLDQHRANVTRWRQIEKDAKDKLSPDAADKASAPVPVGPGAPKANQRGELDGTAPAAYGALTGFGGGTAVAAGATGNPPASPFPLAVPRTSGEDFAPISKTAPLAYASQFDPLKVDVDGVEPDDVTVASAGDPSASEPGATLMTFPVSPARQAEMKARAAELGLQPSAQSYGGEMQQAAIEAGAPAPTPPLGRGKIYDASEGTALDPLRDKSYDLNSAKTVPVLKGLPPIASILH